MTLPWQTLASEVTPEGRLELLRRSDKDFLITLDKRVLMTSAAHRSEVTLAELACAGLRSAKRARVLVSGLGMGFTLRAALDKLGPDAEVIVAELNPVVVEWCEGPLAVLIGNAAQDPRVTMEIVDVTKRIADVAKRKDPRRFDAILLDLFEGPQTRIKPDDALYGPLAIQNAAKALVPGGVLAVWGEAHSPGFERSLRAAGMTFTMNRPDRGGLRHCIYVAKTPRAETRSDRVTEEAPLLANHAFIERRNLSDWRRDISTMRPPRIARTSPPAGSGVNCSTRARFTRSFRFARKNRCGSSRCSR